MSVVQGAEDAPPNAPNESEVEARRMGWVGKDEFKGDPDKWRPADEFLDRGKRILPIVLKDNERLQRNLDRVKDELKELRTSTTELLEFTSKAEERAFNRAKSEIEARIEQSAANADPTAVRTAMQDLDALNKSHTPAPKKTEQAQQTTQIDPEIQDWVDKNKWFNADGVLNAYSLEQYTTLKRDKPGMSESDVLAEVKRRASAKFPEKFGINTERDGAAAVATPSGGASAARKNAKNYENLPPEAKRACDKFVRDIKGYTKEKYVANYDWDA